MADIVFSAKFTASKVGADGIVVTWDIDRVTRSTGAVTALVTGGATNVVYARRGRYGYRLTEADLTLYDYLGTAITADATVDQQEIDAVWTLWSMSGEQAVWNALLTGATYNIATSAGRRLRAITDIVIYEGEVVSSTDNTVVLDAGADATDGAYDPALIYIVSGTGAGQSRLILEYEGAARRAWVDRNWKANPVAGDTFVIAGDPGREHVNEGHAQGGTASSIILNPLASDEDDAYNGQVVFIRSGTGEDQARRITDYDGTTHTATVYPNWDVTPDTTSAGAILPTAVMTNDQISAAVWDGTTGTAVQGQLDTIQAKTDKIGSGSAILTSPVAANGDVEIVRGDSYLNTDSRSLDWTNATWSLAATSAIIVIVQDVVVFTGSRVSATQARLELTSAQSITLPEGTYDFSLQEVQAGGERLTRLQGTWETTTRPYPTSYHFAPMRACESRYLCAQIAALFVNLRVY